MYKEFYLMRKEPFDSHPAPDLFYKSNVHQTAWHYLVQGIKQHEPILVLAGDYGAGKTLLFLKLVRLLDKKGRMPVVAVPTPTYNFVMILEKIVEKLLNISPGGIENADESKLQQVVYEYFENTDTKAPIYVIIDDAQEFSYSFINKLRLFASYNCGGFFPIRLIFFAHHSFLELLTYKKLVALGQRIKRIYHLKPLNFDETREYIYFRLIHSGATGTPVFDDDAIEIIQRISGGNPRLINNICDNCLLVAGEKRVNLIDQGLVVLALEMGKLPGIEGVEKLSSFHMETPLPDMAAPPEPDPLPPAASAVEAALPNQQMSNAYYPQPNYPGVPEDSSQLPPQYAGPPNPAAAVPPTGMHSPQANEPGQQKKYSAPRTHSLASLWSRFGSVMLLIVLLIIAVFLGVYIFSGNRSENLEATQSFDSRKIVRKISSQHYTLQKKIPAGVDDSDAVAGNTDSEYTLSLPLVGKEKAKRYEPVLLAGGAEK